MQLRLFLETALRRWRRYSEVRNELHAYSDRELNDMGLSRADIPRIAREAAAMIEQRPSRAHFAETKARPLSPHSRFSA